MDLLRYETESWDRTSINHQNLNKIHSLPRIITPQCYPMTSFTLKFQCFKLREIDESHAIVDRPHDVLSSSGTPLAVSQ